MKFRSMTLKFGIINNLSIYKKYGIYIYIFILPLIYYMKYLESKYDDKIQSIISLEAKFNTRYTPEQISNEFTNKFEFMDSNYKSSRAMYPDKELTGVTFEYKNISGKIYANRIEIMMRDYNFEKIYSMINSWFEQTNMQIPEQDEFYVKAIILEDIDDDRIYLDSSKVADGKPLNHKFQHNKSDINSKIHEFIDFVFIEFSDSKINNDLAIKCFDDIIEHEYIIIE